MKHQTQLCHQIKEALELSIPADFMLDLVDVIPGNSGSHYIVIFRPLDATFDVEDGYHQLELIREDLQEEIGAEINRRRIPDLTFKIAPQIDWDKINTP